MQRLKIKSITLSATAQTLRSLLSSGIELHSLILQGPAANTGTAYFGNSATQTYEIAKGTAFDFSVLDIDINVDELYVKGTLNDKLTAIYVEED